jgi:hypothetical protein
MKRLAALLFTVVYVSFFAGTLIHAGDESAFSFENIHAEKSAQQVVKDKNANSNWIGFKAHINKTIKHFGTNSKAKWPRVKSVFPSAGYFTSGKRHNESLQSFTSVISIAHTSPLYIKNRVLRL